MTFVGIRELRQRASDILRRVEAGETFEVTDRGRPIARLSPITDLEGVDQLRATGDIDEPHDAFDKLLPPLAAVPSVELPSVTLNRLRADER